ncbi:tRNA (adenine(58)-N(1))-methyltransferase, mitochondrial isoform X1 [Onychostruthus taczanowskii]|uniref:tRNA (adenine(58)-N(1))-methyltransferase, mitochondrial isoform X1 n=1 Tax=Onychostruthus taczanowskii TaxID=356909 RepID=UPI001B80A038|nr:tRNA (adenine(58)-N(1))-methyltransferase, mitochondrial isoform X1 [Onychostruthus taczanowskii]
MRAWRALRRAAAPSSSSSSSFPADGKPRRRAWETSLSPLERVRRLLPPEEAAAVAQPPQAPPKEEEEEVAVAAPRQALAEAAAPRSGPFRAGELALAEVRRKHNSTLKLLCRLAAEAVLSSPGGLLPHRDIIGRLPGQVLLTASGKRLLLRRPSLDEYVLLMPRGATIAYPKDISALLMMMDIHPGDTVLETGSGSGAMSLFLSRAVGPKGRVLSYEIREDHHNLAKKNYRHWRSAWEIGHVDEWPDNVEFILKDISTAAADLKSVTLDAVVLDMLNPQCALPVVHPSLKQGGVCAVYLANITQVIDLLDRIRSCKLPFLCERIIEVTHRSWSVLPAKLKHYKSSQMVETQENIEEPLQNEYEEIHIEDQAVLKESECYGKDFAADKIPYYCTLITQCRRRQCFYLGQLRIGKVLDSLDLVRFKEDY